MLGKKASAPVLCAALVALGCQGTIDSPQGAAPAPSGAGGSSGNGSSGTGGDPMTGISGDPAELCAQQSDTLRIGRTRLRRLTRTQLDNTVRDLLGAEGTPADAIAPDERIGPFYSNAIAPITDLLVQQHAEVAARLAQAAATRMQALSPCDLTQAADTSCASQFIQSFGQSAYRRPLDAAEQSRYLALYELERATGTAESAFTSVVETMLQSPFFLYHVDVGPELAPSDTPVRLTSYELASRLSYFIWGSMPDAALFQLAAAESLQDERVLATEVERLLADARATEAIATFHLQWLGIGDMAGVEKDPARFPQWGDALSAAMRSETRELTDFVVRRGDGLMSTLFAGGFSFPSGPLFQLYGLTEPPGFVPGTRVDLDGFQRVGLLTQAAFLATHAHRDQSSPVHRGIMVRENLLCQPLASPPATVNTMPPPVSEVTTTRERFSAHEADPSCATCHVLIDPIGLGFENYDPIGAYRTTDANQPVDASGEITGAGADLDGSFVGAVELSRKLGASSAVRNCLANQWLRYALGRMEANDDACSVKSMHDRFAESGGNVRQLLTTIAQSDSFRHVRTGSGQ
jgi:hypothetical protein